jgi:ABC-type branched-subunit amino acid transport system ATPase component
VADAGTILRVEDVSRRFGGVQALRRVSLDIPSGRIVGLIGPNGSGKTTLFNVITGLVRPSAGRVLLREAAGGAAAMRAGGAAAMRAGEAAAMRDISRLPPHRINQLGVGRTFQLTRLFGQMTALENMLVVGRHEDGANRARAAELLEFVDLHGVSDEYAANLSYGQQKLLEFARLLMVEPALILLDEPFAGVNPTMARRLRERLQTLAEQGTTLLVTDHEMKTMMALCSELFVLDYGELIAHGSPAAVRSDPRVMEAYFGR